jgi:hypothetical protein
VVAPQARDRRDSIEPRHVRVDDDRVWFERRRQLLTGDAAPALHQAADEPGADGVFVKGEFLEKLLTHLARVAESRQRS